MGRKLHRENSSIQFREGCLWHVLHHWKVVQHKKHGRRRAICCGNPKTISMDRHTGEAQILLDADADNFDHPTKVGPSDKSIKALITEEMSNGENPNHWFMGFPAQTKFQRTNSIHHLEPSDYRLGKINSEWANPIIILHKNANTSASGLQFSSQEQTSGRLNARNEACDFCDSVNVEGSLAQHQSSGKHAQVKSDKIVDTLKSEKQMDAKQQTREIFHHQVKEYADVLEIFKVNKELFLKFFQDPDDGVSKQFPGQQISNRNVKLTKSGSFPVADVSRVRYLRPSTLEHKQNETWTFPKGEKLVSNTQVLKPDVVRSLKGYNEKTVGSLVDQGVGSSMKHKTTFSSWDSSHVSNPQKWNRLVVGRVRGIKQRIKLAIKGSKKVRKKSNTDGLLEGVPSTCSQSTVGKEMPKNLDNGTSQDVSDNFISCHEADVPDHDLNSSKLHRVRRTASLNESMDRYTQLFESSFRREAKLPHSKSLKLRNEDDISSRQRAPKFFRRISSLSDLESFCSLINEVVHDSEKAIRTEVDCNINTGSCNHSELKLSSFSVDADKHGALDAVVESEFQKNIEKEGDSHSSIENSGGLIVSRVDEEIAGMGKLGENMVEPANVKSISQEDQKIDSPVNPTVGLKQPSLLSETETRFADDIMNTAERTISEGSESNPPCINGSGEDSLPSLYSKVNHEKNSQLHHFELDNEVSSFNYVRDVLQLSGFIENESIGKWYSLDQPLDPSLFKEMESNLHHEAQSTEEFGGNCDHQLLFNLISEVLLEMYEKSFTYFPRTFSFNHHIRPMHKGHRLLEEVWARICRYLSVRSELDRSLDDIVAQDLSKGDGWMDHQFETECVALELEELIFDELLYEVICP